MMKCTYWALLLGIGSLTACGAEAPGSSGANESTESVQVGSTGQDLALGASGTEVQAWYDYLHQYGYFPNDELASAYPMWRPAVAHTPANTSVFDAALQTATQKFQQNMGLPETGVVDQATRQLAAQPRCAYPDSVSTPDASDKWSLSNTGSWGKNNLTWKLVNTDDGLSATNIKSQIASILSTYSSFSAYTFTDAGTGAADIVIKFGSFSDPNVNASTTAIQNGGDVTLNTARNWSMSDPVPSGSMDLPSILAHELGHALGLGHSSFTSAVMYGIFNNGQSPKRLLTPDDAVASLAMNIEWQQFDDYSDSDLAFNTHAFGSSIWVIGGDPVAGGQQIWELINASSWVLHPGGAVRVAVNPKDTNVPWVVNDAGNIFRYNSSVDGWDQVPGCATDVGVGSDNSVWVIGCSNVTGGKNIRKFKGTFPCSSDSACWTTVTGGALRIAVGPGSPGGANVPWVVNNANKIYRRNSASTSSGSFDQLAGGGLATDIGASDGYAWITTTTPTAGGYTIQAWNEQVAGPGGPPAPELHQWVTVPGGAVGITVNGGLPLIVNDAGQLFWTL